MTEAIAAVNDFAFRTLDIERLDHSRNAGVQLSVTAAVKQKTGAELVGHIEVWRSISGQTRSELWKVTRESWLGRRTIPASASCIKPNDAARPCRVTRSQRFASGGLASYRCSICGAP